MKILIAGGTGFIGKHLIKSLESDNHKIILLTRNAKKYSADSKNTTLAEWNGQSQGRWTKYISEADAVINLCGANIGEKRWTEKRKEEMVNSRLNPLKALTEAISTAERKPKVFISSSAVGYYGNTPRGNPVTEKSGMGKDLLAYICMLWEDAAEKISKYDVRVAYIRSGIVLSKTEGAFPKMLMPFRFFIGGPLGSGEQGLAWIHYEDEIGIIRHVLMNENISGAVNAVAPEMLSNKEFFRILGKVMKRPSFFQTPSFLLRLVLGEMSLLILEGQYVKPEVALNTGYHFKFPKAEDALKNILK